MRFSSHVLNGILMKGDINVLFSQSRQTGFYVITEKFLLSHSSVFTQVLMLTPPVDARICSVVFEPAAALANDS